MAINKTTRKAAVKEVLKTAGFVISDDNDAFIDALIDDIIDEITTNGVVTTAVTGTLPSGPVAAVGLGVIS